ncbi:hypothetical protein ACS0TY_032959 [Phlomoides rotata]
MASLLLCTILLLTSAASATTVGITYNPSAPNLPPPEHVASTLRSLSVSAVRLINPTPDAVRAFAYTNISLLLTVPNHFIPSFATNRSTAALWLYSHVFPYYPRTQISLISAGSDVITSAATADPTLDPSTVLLPAMRNLQQSLLDLGIRTIPVSTTFSFIDIMTASFPPSAAEFQEPIGSLIIRPLLHFLDETNSSFLINLYPYNVYRINSEIPIGYVLFEEHPFNFRDDIITGVRYRNLFDMMVDAVIAAIAVSGEENIPVIVTETGWPTDPEADAIGNYAERYLTGLVKHLKSGMGTPLRKEGVAQAYIYELFDDEGELRYNSPANGTSGDAVRRSGSEHHWGIMYSNMTMKFKFDFSCSILVNEARNDFIFEHKLHDLLDIISRSTTLATDFSQNCRPGHGPVKAKVPHRTWSPPPSGSLKLNSNAACFLDGSVGFGFIIRNERGKVHLAGSKRCTAAGHSTMIEALALRFGLQQARERGFRPRVLESDCFNLIMALNGREEEDPQTILITDDILSMTDILECPEFVFSGRETNRTAHRLAHLASTLRHIPSVSSPIHATTSATTTSALQSRFLDAVRDLIEWKREAARGESR